MTTLTDTADGSIADHGHGGSYLTARKGLASWIFTLDHKRIGVMYLVSIMIFFAIAGFLALGVRLELMTPKGDLLTADTYNKFFQTSFVEGIYNVLVRVT